MTPGAPSRARVLAALEGRRVDPVPAGSANQTATVMQMEELGVAWPDAHHDAEALANLADGARVILGFETVHVPFDQTIEAELLGAGIDPGDRDRNCSVHSHPLSIGDPVPPLPDLDRGRARVVTDAIRILRERCGDRAAILGGIVGPFTLVSELAGIAELLMKSLTDPGSVVPYLDLAVRIGIEYGRRQARAGADAISVEDMGASLDVTSPQIYESLILGAQQRVIAGLEVPAVLHVCGGNTKILHLLVRTGARALSLEERTDLSAAVAEGSTAVLGGVSPTEILLEGSPEDVRRSSRESLARGVHVLAPGCALAPRTPTENVREMVRVAREGRP